MSDHEEAPAKAGAPKSKLKTIGNIVLLSLGPLLAIAALGLAGLSFKNMQGSEGQLEKSQAKVEELNASLQAAKLELDQLKLAALRDKNAQEDARKKLEARLSLAIQNISPIQKKLKIKPTLEEQLQQAAEGGAPIPASVPVSMVAHPAEKKHESHETHETVKLSRPEHPRHSSHQETTHEQAKGQQVEALKDALEKFNKK